MEKPTLRPFLAVCSKQSNYTPNSMKATIDKLYAELDEALKRADALRTAIATLQKVCEHKTETGSDAMIRYGYDSHYTYYKCAICHHEIKI